MNLKPISMKPASSTLIPLIQSVSLNDLSNNNNNNNNPNNRKYSPDQSYELVENSLTVRENEEFLINCIVESSKPAADVKFMLSDNLLASSLGDMPPSLNSNQYASYLTLSPQANNSSSGIGSSYLVSTNIDPVSSSILSSNTNTVKNIDRTFKTIHSTRLKVSQHDHGKVLSCKAENGFSNQKWENKKLLNVLFSPVCKHTPRHTFYVGINQTTSVECGILNANPARVTYEWDLNSVHGIVADYPSKYSPPSNVASKLNDINVVESNDEAVASAAAVIFQANSAINHHASAHSIRSSESKYTNVQNDGFTSRFKWRPTSMSDFGEIVCKATNEIGTTECIYEIKLGGVPNPPTDCNHILKNTSAIISCQVGFHQVSGNKK
jgi:hypothetical protein